MKTRNISQESKTTTTYRFQLRLHLPAALLLLSLMLQGCGNIVGDMDFGIGTTNTSKFDSFTVYGKVTLESGIPVDSATVTLVNRPYTEDPEMGGYDYTHLGEFSTDTLGNYQLSHTTRYCGNRHFLVRAHATVDSVLYTAPQEFVSCSGDTEINFVLEEATLGF